MNTEFHPQGWAKVEEGEGPNDVLSLHVGYVEGRSRPTLYIIDDNKIYPLASFVNEKAATILIRVLASFFTDKNKENEQ
jgi:hypothetical protein